jgi:hypothetical protein
MSMSERESTLDVIRRQIESQTRLLQESRERRRQLFDEIDGIIATLGGLCIAYEEVLVKGDQP